MSVLVSVDWILLGCLAYATLWAVIERLQYHCVHRPANPSELACLLIRWEQRRKIANSKTNLNLGWFGNILEEVGCDPQDLLSSCYAERDAALRWQTFLPMAANLAVSAGLLGSVLALEKTAHSRDVNRILGLGMHATISGVLIAIVAGLAYLFLRKRTASIVAQTERVIDTLEEILAIPAASETNELPIEKPGQSDVRMPVSVYRPDRHEKPLEGANPATYRLAAE